MKEKVTRIFRDIRSIKIQGATNIAKAAIEAYHLSPTKKTYRTLLSLRPTEPTLANALHTLKSKPKEEVLAHFLAAQERINSLLLPLLRKSHIIYTHCHSTNVLGALVYASHQGAFFEVYNTETRPLFQGRRTAKELSAKGIKVTSFVDSAFYEAISKADLILLGADAILKEGVINKVGSATIADLAKLHKKPLYIVADSWKFSHKNVPLEERDFHEVWKQVPKSIRIANPAFEKIPKKLIKGVISEYGILSFDKFIKKATKNMP